jgi:hypothetical protein
VLPLVALLTTSPRDERIFGLQHLKFQRLEVVCLGVVGIGIVIGTVVRILVVGIIGGLVSLA